MPPGWQRAAYDPDNCALVALGNWKRSIAEGEGPLRLNPDLGDLHHHLASRCSILTTTAPPEPHRLHFRAETVKK